MSIKDASVHVVHSEKYERNEKARSFLRENKPIANCSAFPVYGVCYHCIESVDYAQTMCVERGFSRLNQFYFGGV